MFSACSIMDGCDAELTASLVTPTGAAEHEREGGELEPTVATPRSPEPPASGSAPASGERVVESPSGIRRSGREPTARRGNRYPGNDPGKDLLDEISALKEQQKKAREEKQAITKELRNANRRRQRLKRRAKALSDADLMAVISLRNHERALGRHPSAEEEEEDEDSDSELEDQTGNGSAPSDAPSPAKPKKQPRKG